MNFTVKMRLTTPFKKFCLNGNTYTIKLGEIRKPHMIWVIPCSQNKHGKPILMIFYYVTEVLNVWFIVEFGIFTVVDF